MQEIRDWIIGAMQINGLTWGSLFKCTEQGRHKCSLKSQGLLELERVSSRTCFLGGRKIKCHASGHQTDGWKDPGRAQLSLWCGVMDIMFESCRMRLFAPDLWSLRCWSPRETGKSNTHQPQNFQLSAANSVQGEHQLSVLFLYNIPNMKRRSNSFVCWTMAAFPSRAIAVGLIRAMQWSLLPAALSPNPLPNSNPHSLCLRISLQSTYQPDGFCSGKRSLMHFSAACFWKTPKTLISCLPQNGSILVIKL